MNRNEQRKSADKKYREANKERIKKLRDANKIAAKKYSAQWREINKEYKAKLDKEYKTKNAKKIKLQNKLYIQNNKAKYNAYRSNRRKTDPLFRLTLNSRNIIRKVLINNNFKKNNRTHHILGCSYDELKQHIEKQFESWMNWDNYGKYNGKLNYGWDIDHIIPLSSAKTEDEIITLCHYTNLQPLCSYTNRYLKKALL